MGERVALRRGNDRDLVLERGRGERVNDRDLSRLGSGLRLLDLEYFRAGVSDRFGVKDFFRGTYGDRVLDFDRGNTRDLDRERVIDRLRRKGDLTGDRERDRDRLRDRFFTELKAER